MSGQPNIQLASHPRVCAMDVVTDTLIQVITGQCETPFVARLCSTWIDAATPFVLCHGINHDRMQAPADLGSARYRRAHAHTCNREEDRVAEARDASPRLCPISPSLGQGMTEDA